VLSTISFPLAPSPGGNTLAVLDAAAGFDMDRMYAITVPA
jgi:hypothetical protein